MVTFNITSFPFLGAFELIIFLLSHLILHLCRLQLDRQTVDSVLISHLLQDLGFNLSIELLDNSLFIALAILITICHTINDLSNFFFHLLFNVQGEFLCQSQFFVK